jgi:hypothetical protein
MRANWALLGWEGWVKYSDGRHGHTPGGVMGIEVERKEGEAWEANPEYAHLVLCFCLTATPPKD